MKKFKVVSLLVSFLLIISMFAGCASTEKKEAAENSTQSSEKSSDKAPAKEVKITLLNSKGEIQAQLEDAAVV